MNSYHIKTNHTFRNTKENVIFARRYYICPQRHNDHFLANKNLCLKYSHLPSFSKLVLLSGRLFNLKALKEVSIEVWSVQLVEVCIPPSGADKLTNTSIENTNHSAFEACGLGCSIRHTQDFL